jgi:cell division transport system ATP-binding protein
VLVATHDREMVDRMRRRVLALDQGRLVRDQDTAGYMEESTGEFAVRVRAEMGVAEGHTNGEPTDPIGGHAGTPGRSEPRR